MHFQFSKIGLMGKHSHPESFSTLTSIISFLQAQSFEITIEANFAKDLPPLSVKKCPIQTMGECCDLIIVVGGDGSFLSAARAVVDYGIPVVGVNRGRRGFLTDISPQVLSQSLEPILNGKYQEERRFLLEMKLIRKEKAIAEGMALNDIVIFSGDIARMMEFEVLINKQFVYRQRSDGLITATPTGSTAHALAAGGPILSPSLQSIVLVPMQPSVLSSRPIVIDSQSQIELHFTSEDLYPRISCDGQLHFDMQPDDRLLIQRKTKELRLLHPKDYDYYHTLRTKLGWSA